eukprot:scaffold190_cov185-Alexandrium_tamarense.AAC.9
MADNNFVRGLHMDHFINNSYDDNLAFESNFPTAHQTVDEDLEAMFPNDKGCVCQTADDVGYLFGCGTSPVDELVYVHAAPEIVPRDNDGGGGIHRGRNYGGGMQGDNYNNNCMMNHRHHQQQQYQEQQYRRPQPLKEQFYPRNHYQNEYNYDDPPVFSAPPPEGGCMPDALVDLLLPPKKKTTEDKSKKSNKMKMIATVSDESSTTNNSNGSSKENLTSKIYELQKQLKSLAQDKSAAHNQTELERLRLEQQSLDNARMMLQMQLDQYQHMQQQPMVQQPYQATSPPMPWDTFGNTLGGGFMGLGNQTWLSPPTSPQSGYGNSMNHSGFNYMPASIPLYSRGRSCPSTMRMGNQQTTMGSAGSVNTMNYNGSTTRPHQPKSYHYQRNDNYAHNEEQVIASNNTMLNEIQLKNARIREEITRMKNGMGASIAGSGGVGANQEGVGGHGGSSSPSPLRPLNQHSYVNSNSTR